MLGTTRVLLATWAILVLPISVIADKVEISGGAFQFVHPPVNPEQPDGVCHDPPGLIFVVESQEFGGTFEIKNSSTSFAGSGVATGCAYEEPIEGVGAVFSGPFSWDTAEGELWGSFELVDYVTDSPLVFMAVVSIRFEGGTGRFNKAKGEAIAFGLDYPFGFLNGVPTDAGLDVDTLVGQLKLKE